MKEYTILAVISVILAVVIDFTLKIRVLRNPLFYLFIIIIFGFKLLVNGYLTATNIVSYNPYFYLGLRLGSIPVEDFIFGFSMVVMATDFWEYFRNKRA